jgi:uncharacterized membrane protein SpoIIM required for sporulation
MTSVTPQPGSPISKTASPSGTPAYTNIQNFLKTNREDWDALEKNLLEFRRSQNCSFNELETLHALYLKVSQHVSVCQTYYPNSQLATYLNDLAARAHNTLYKGRVSSWSQLKHFFSQTFVDLFVERRGFIALAAFLFFLGSLVGFLTVQSQPEALNVIMPNASPVDPETLRAGRTDIAAASTSAYIMTNNISVAIMAFCGGATLGILTVYMLLYNGLIIGALAAYYWNLGASYEFWAYIMPHGMIELTAIFIAGGAGLLMGYKVLVPGNYSRLHQFKTQAAQSCMMVLGTIPLFIIAGLVEGYITPSGLPLIAKYAVAFLTVVAMIVYLVYGMRQTRKQNPVLSFNNPDGF